MFPTLGLDAAKLKALADTDETRDTQDAGIDAAILGLASDRAAVARAQHRLKAQLELAFDEAKKVYSFSDFSASKEAKKAKNKANTELKA